MHVVLTQLVACQSVEWLVGPGESFFMWKVLWKATLGLDAVLQLPLERLKKKRSG